MYGDSCALSSDSSLIFPISNSKEREEVASVKRETLFPFMEPAEDTSYSEFGQQFGGCNSNSLQNSSGSLLRFRSAPTSLLAGFTVGGEKSEKLESMFCSGELMSENDDTNCKKSRFTAMNPPLPPQYPRQSDAQLGYRVGSDQHGQDRIGSNLLRQNSSPAGLFSHLNSQTGYSGIRGIGRYRMGDGSGNGELSPSSSRFKNHMDFPSGLPGMLSRINEVEHENTGPMGGPEEGRTGDSSGDSLFFSPQTPFSSWTDSPYFAENFTCGIKRELDHDPKLFVNTERCEPGNRPNILSHHLRLPNTSTELAAVEKLMHLQDTVPCKVRAKRGCATHPRSIAERVRRTRISERMRKLQELVPNMDKQTNTADMLDLAVKYIKGLQRQYKTLSDNQSNCKCLAFQKADSDQTH